MRPWVVPALLVAILVVDGAVSILFGFMAGIFWLLMAAGVSALVAMAMAPTWDGLDFDLPEPINPLQPVADLTNAGYPPGSLAFAMLRVKVAFDGVGRAIRAG